MSIDFIPFNRFKKFKSVIGYELLNEPGPANIYHGNQGDVDMKNLFPGIIGKNFLTQFYDRIQKEIRKEDEESIIFWEPVCRIINFLYANVTYHYK